MLIQSARPSSRHKSSVTRRRSRTLNCAILETLERRTLLSAVQLDPSFGTGGIVNVNFAGFTYGLGLAISNVQPDGKILVAGEASNDVPGQPSGDGDVALARLNADGTLDTTFGSGGKVTASFGGINRADSIVRRRGKPTVRRFRVQRPCGRRSLQCRWHPRQHLWHWRIGLVESGL